MSIAYIALGSSVGDRLAYLRAGKEAIARAGEIVAASPIYETEPVDTKEPERFLNAVVAVRTERSPEELLAFCLDSEKENGRARGARNAPRTLDMDVLLYDDLTVNSERLTLPHPRMHERAFVLAPLADIAPELAVPSLNASVDELLSRVKTEGFVSRTDDSL